MFSMLISVPQERFLLSLWSVLTLPYGQHHPKTSDTREHLQTVLHLLESGEKKVRQDAKHLE